MLPETIQVNGAPRPDVYDPTTHTLVYQQQGLFADELAVSITYTALVAETSPIGSTILNEAELDIAIDGAHFPITLNDSAAVLVAAAVDEVYLPLGIRVP